MPGANVSKQIDGGARCRRTILHCDMDAFYASIEQRDRPELRGKPVVVGGLGRRGVVSTASYEARKFGIHSAMPTARARQLAPNAIFLPPRMSAYAAVSEEIQQIFHRYTPLVEPLSLDEAFLDVTASFQLFGGGEAIARSIQKDVRDTCNLTISIGVAAAKYVAKVASDLKKPAGLTVVPPGEEVAFLAPLPVSRIWGAGRVTQARLEQLGMRTIGELQRATLAELITMLGSAAGEHFYWLCRGVDPREVETAREAKSIGRETTFEVDITKDEECERVLLELSQAVGRTMRREGVRGAVVKVKIRFPPFVTITRQRKLAAATFDDLIIYHTAAELLREAREPGRPVRLLGVSAAELCESGAPRQLNMFDAGRAGGGGAQRLLAVMDKIRDKFGERAIGRGGV